MAGSVSVSNGHLDGLLGLTFNAFEFEGVDFKSWTATPGPDIGIDTMTVVATGLPAPGHSSDETVTVSAIDDQQNQITLNFGSYQITEFAIGFSQSSILLSQQSLTRAVLSLGVTPSFPLPASVQTTLEPVTGMLTMEPVPVGTPTTFSAESGTSLLSPGPAGLSAFDTTTDETPLLLDPIQYTGPVAGVNSEYISTSSDSLNFYAATPGWFIKGGSGLTGMSVTSGVNVLDSGSGSAFMTGGTGTNLFFVHADNLMTNTWSTVEGFHSGDSVTFWGITQTDFSLDWLDNQGASGATGLTLVATTPGGPVARVTMAGFSSADLTKGRLSVSFLAGQATQPPALLIHENS